MKSLQRAIKEHNSILIENEELKNLTYILSEKESDFNKKLYDKVNVLLYAGKNVLKKILTPEEFKEFEKGGGIFSRQLKLNWLRINLTQVDFRVWKTNSERADIILIGVDYKGDYLSYAIPADSLNYSIRDFAKLVRARTKEALLKTWSIEIQIAEDTISKNKNKIEKSSF